jgi:hypothetical protein
MTSSRVEASGRVALQGKGLAGLEPAELPAPPRSLLRVIGPGIVAAGVGLGSGEFVIFPYIASQVGLAFLWAIQYFLNTEIERYTLATGETVLTGFSRLGRHWGLFLAALGMLHSLWPGWASSSATMVTYLVGGDVRWITIGMLLAVGCILTLSPVVYRTLERVQSVKMAAIILLIAGSALFAIPSQVWVDAPSLAAQPAFPVEEFGWAMLAGAIAYAGAGGPSNLCQSSWIRDKGFGMGAYAARIESPIFGEPIAMPGTGWKFDSNDPSMMARWRAWWRFVRVEQLSTFVPMSIATIIFTSVLAYALLRDHADLPQGIAFLGLEGQILSERVGAGFGRLFWIVGAFALFMTSVGVVDVVGRLTADVVRTNYWTGHSESVIYALVVWAMVGTGIAIIASGASQPLALLVISAVIAAFMMFVYSVLLLILNRRLLDPPLRPSLLRTGALVFAIGLFGVLSGATILEQIERFMP